ncbi:MAG: CBS domain-containing protein [Myxococcales bacterium]|nr:CBS domain-containing protein [Myxococcales bacterium]
MPLVRDIMSRRVISVSPEAPIDALSESLTKLGIDGAPVRDEEGHFLGFVSKTDLLAVKRWLGDGPVPSVSEVMSPVVIAIADSEDVRAAIDRMLKTGVHRLLVVDPEEQAVGIVTPMDILHAIARGVLRFEA